jgi:hypothetical protein
VSTVLDAIRERDGRGASGAAGSIADPGQRHRIGRTWLVAGLGVAGAALLPVFRTTWRAEVVEAPPAPAVSPPRAGEVAEPVAPAVRTRPTVPLGEAPRARVGPWAPAAPRLPMTPPAPAVAPASPGQGVAAAPSGTTAPAPGAERSASPPASPLATRAVHLESIRYGAGPMERAATLTIDGATPVTLRQGESAGDVEVQLVLPRAVYVRRGGEIFALGELR